MCTSPILGPFHVKSAMGFTRTASWYESPGSSQRSIRLFILINTHHQPFHNDMGCEILALHIRNCAAQGGGTYVASAAAVYNALMKTNPQVVHTLAEHEWPVQV